MFQAFAEEPTDQLDTASHREPTSGTDTTLRIAFAVLTFATLLYWLRIVRIGIADFAFDDALMFVRYALHLRHGYGLAWNSGEQHTFGMTSLTWMAFVWLGSYLPLPPITMLVGASCFFGLISLALIASSTHIVHGSGARVPWVWVFPVIALPLLLNAHFNASITNGMETMLAMTLVAVFLTLVQRAFLRGRLGLAVAAGIIGWLTVITRPESLLCVLAFPLCWWFLVDERRQPKIAMTIVTVLVALIILTLAVNSMYFGSPVPLAFYMKWLRGYAGYRLFLNPIAYTAYFLNMAMVPCIVLGLHTERRHVRLLLAFGVPLSLQVAYLATVLQIMGWGGRYYVPYLPFIFLPALLVLNDSFGQGWRALPRVTGPRLGALLATMLVVNLQTMTPVYEVAGRFITRHWTVYAPPDFITGTDRPLPVVNWWVSCVELGRLAATLPAGTVISSSEVGMLGAAAPDVNVIDTSGLNDSTIAKHGFSAQYVLSRSPELIWLIHSDYTRDYGELASAPELLRRYTLYAGAFDFGVAILKDGPHHGQVLAAFQKAWNDVYPGFDMQRYEVKQVRWDSTPVVNRYRLAVVQP